MHDFYRMELADRIQRTGSLYESDPQEQLLKSFQKGNYERFVNLISGGDINVNHVYGEPHHATILDLCANGENSNKFLRTVLNHGADPNIINRLRKKAPIHVILERNDLTNLSTLLEFQGKLDVNIADSFGNTPLHIAAKGSKKAGSKDTTCLQMLLNIPGINVNAVNRKGLTPAHLAATHGNKDALLLLVRYDGIDLESNRDFMGKSAKDLILEKYDDILLLDKSLVSLPPTVTPDYVFSLLRANNIDLFKKALNANKGLLNASDGLYTLLQHACDHGMYDIAEFLIQSGADVNKTNNSTQYTPIMLASRKGYHNIVKKLIKSDVDIFSTSVNMETVFHCAVNGSVESSQLGDSEEGKDHAECLDVLLLYSSKWALINKGDFKGNTPLHLAGRIGNDDMVFKLLDAGAYAGCVNVFNEPALSYISPVTFERYLDRCVRTNDKLPREEGYEIIINYKSLVPPLNNGDSDRRDGSKRSYRSSFGDLNETDLLLYTSKSQDLRHLLMHPVLKSLIFMKWYDIRKWFYVNLLFYLLFWGFLSTYILVVYDATKSFQSNTNKTVADHLSPNSNPSRGFLWYSVTSLLVLLMVRELFQFKKSYKHYLVNPENWLEIGLIMLSIIILFVNVGDETKHQLAASAILLSWTELVLLIGKHPALSTHIEMLKTVGWNFFKFLSWYSILIVAFALSFYTLFRNGPESEDEDEDSKVFIDPGVSVFKTIVMLTGEFEAGEIPFDRYPFTSHMLFVLFVFAIAIVLYNLLNGLAVSDTQAIKADAEMVGYISRIKLVSYVETIDFLPCKNIFANIKNCDFSQGNRTDNSLSREKTTLSIMVDYEIHIFPNDRNKVAFPSSPRRPKRNNAEDTAYCCLLESRDCKDTVMDSTIVKSAQLLLNKKQEGSESFFEPGRFGLNDKLLDEYKKTLEAYKIVLKQMTETEIRIRNLTETIRVSDKK